MKEAVGKAEEEKGVATEVAGKAEAAKVAEREGVVTAGVERVGVMVAAEMAAAETVAEAKEAAATVVEVTEGGAMAED